MFRSNYLLLYTNFVAALTRCTEPDLGFGSTSEEFLSLEFDISQQPEAEIRQVATDLQKLRARKSDSGGWEGIKNEIQRSYAGLMDSQVRAALSPPYHFDFAWLTEDDFPPALVNIMEDIEFAETSGPIIRALFTSALIYKRRSLGSRPQFWLLDEISACGAWPLAVKLSTISAGYGIRTVYVCQSTKQLDALSKDAGAIIANSCGTSIYLGTRSADQAALISRQLGKATISYDDFAMQERARAAQSKALTDAVFGDGGMMGAMMSAAHHARLAEHKTKAARDLRSIDEVINESYHLALIETHVGDSQRA